MANWNLARKKENLRRKVDIRTVKVARKPRELGRIMSHSRKFHGDFQDLIVARWQGTQLSIHIAAGNYNTVLNSIYFSSNMGLIYIEKN